ncbi:hypothetical protein BD289DRAFT_276649 [Coniella lustricola]|uniref:Secreted protein n=1 Tax=Coniella lustricola TaxID=2025994 RepID=A0A2T3A6P8_9PEZI|nr:hypothetical protein BD289DRAFT_276649 [Coniella lustricola]
MRMCWAALLLGCCWASVRVGLVGGGGSSSVESVSRHRRYLNPLVKLDRHADGQFAQYLGNTHASRCARETPTRRNKTQQEDVRAAERGVPTSPKGVGHDVLKQRIGQSTLWGPWLTPGAASSNAQWQRALLQGLLHLVPRLDFRFCNVKCPWHDDGPLSLEHDPLVSHHGPDKQQSRAEQASGKLQNPGAMRLVALPHSGLPTTVSGRDIVRPLASECSDGFAWAELWSAR